MYNNVHIMNVTLYRTYHKGEKFPDQWRFSKNEILNDEDFKYISGDLEEYKKQCLYFANEHTIEIENSYPTGKLIIARWVHGSKGYHIHGVWNLQNFINP